MTQRQNIPKRNLGSGGAFQKNGSATTPHPQSKFFWPKVTKQDQNLASLSLFHICPIFNRCPRTNNKKRELRNKPTNQSKSKHKAKCPYGELRTHKLDRRRHLQIQLFVFFSTKIRPTCQSLTTSRMPHRQYPTPARTS